MKFFFSYSRSVKQDVGKIIELFRASQHDVWWDADIPELADWWSTILDNIESCDVFVFVVSEKSVESPYCLAELDYATKRNRPILPFLVDDIAPDKIPASVTPTRNQWFKYDGDATRTLKLILDAVKKLNREQYKDISAPRPPEPNTGLGSLIKQFQQGARLAESGYFDEAIKHFRNVSSLDFKKWGNECQTWIAKIQEYAEIADLADDKSTQRLAKTKWQEFLDMYDSDFDPFDLNSKLSIVIDVTHPKPVKKEISSGNVLDNLVEWNRKVKEILPEPFEWCFVPEGSLKLTGKKATNIPAFAISKYTVTVQQFEIFVQASDGYIDGEWWDFSQEAREWRSQNTKPTASLTPPSNAKNGRKKADNIVEKYYPRTYVNWFEAIAFCRWLSVKTDLNITLPTAKQWQRAAQGDDKRKYSWGNVIDNTRCNYGQYGNIGTICDVREYPRGVSPFGVMNMCGNVGEWADGIVQFSPFGEDVRFLYGGSYRSSSDNVTTASSVIKSVVSREENIGFRCVIRLKTK
jgi:hypothetical protein